MVLSASAPCESADVPGASPFLARDQEEWVASNELAFALRDRFPVSAGHTLVIPRRLVATWFEATSEEQKALFELVTEVKLRLDEEFQPDGFNVGFNVGEAAGQTVMHLHVHVIPRYRGDMDDPRGGVRGAIPSKQKYELGEPVERSARPFACLPSFVYGDDQHFADCLREALRHADRADIVSAFVQTSGLSLLLGNLRDALRRGVRLRILTGDYLGITRPDALRQLLRLADEHAELTPLLFEVAEGRAFHPKAYLFFNGPCGVAYVGSSNLSQSALTDGVEWNLRLVSSQDSRDVWRIRPASKHLVTSPRTKLLTRALDRRIRATRPGARRPSPREPRRDCPSPMQSNAKRSTR